jgi:hypothetical protein
MEPQPLALFAPQEQVDQHDALVALRATPRFGWESAAPGDLDALMARVAGFLLGDAAHPVRIARPPIGQGEFGAAFRTLYHPEPGPARVVKLLFRVGLPGEVSPGYMEETLEEAERAAAAQNRVAATGFAPRVHGVRAVVDGRVLRVMVEMDLARGVPARTLPRRDRDLAYHGALVNALAAMYSVGVLHGDLHGGNVLVHRARGATRVTLIDFGMAMEQPFPHERMSILPTWPPFAVFPLPPFLAEPPNVFQPWPAWVMPPLYARYPYGVFNMDDDRFKFIDEDSELDVRETMRSVSAFFGDDADAILVPYIRAKVGDYLWSSFDICKLEGLFLVSSAGDHRVWLHPQIYALIWGEPGALFPLPRSMWHVELAALRDFEL